MVTLEEVCERLEEVHPDCTPMIGETDDHGELLFVYYPTDDDRYPESILGRDLGSVTFNRIKELEEKGYVVLEIDT